MDPITFIKTIYLGDRVCKKIILDGLSKQVKIQVNLISRIRDPSGLWNFYDDEDVEDGLIVMSGVESFTIKPEGFIPNDYIEAEVELLREQNLHGNSLYLFKYYMGYVDDFANSREIMITAKAASVHLEDPLRPDKQIRN